MGNTATGAGDELLIAWIHNWVNYALTTNPTSLFDANTFFPYHNTLAYSDLFITSSLLSFIPLKIIGQPIAAFNFTFISSLMLLGFSVYLLSYYLTRNFFASLFAGVLIIFSPAVLDKKVHLQILAVEWVPLAILFFIHFLKSNRTKFLAISLLFFLLQTYNSFMPGYFIVFFITIYLAQLFFIKRLTFLKLFLRKNILLFLVSISLLVPIIIPYYKVSYEFNASRDIKDSIHFALQPEDFINGNEHTRLQIVLNRIDSIEHIPANAETKPGYLGFAMTILSFFAFIYFAKKIKKNSVLINSFLYTALLGLLLSLGPFLHLARFTIHRPFPIPLPYLLFYYILPGFAGFRNSGRFEMLFIICICILIAHFLNTVEKKFGNQTKILSYILIFSAVIAEFNFPMKFIKIPTTNEFPKIYDWIDQTPKNSSFILIPAYTWNSPNASLEILREYYSTKSFRKMVNGYSGFTPPPWKKFIEDIGQNFPQNSSLDKIRERGVTYVVVEKNILLNGDMTLEELNNNSKVELIKQIDNYYVFKFN